MMNGLKKATKVLISLSCVWVLLALAYSLENSHVSNFTFLTLFIFISFPVVVYWLGSWIFGLRWPIVGTMWLIKWGKKNKRKVGILLLCLLFLACALEIRDRARKERYRKVIYSQETLDDGSDVKNEYEEILLKYERIDEKSGLPIP